MFSKTLPQQGSCTSSSNFWWNGMNSSHGEFKPRHIGRSLTLQYIQYSYWLYFIHRKLHMKSSYVECVFSSHYNYTWCLHSQSGPVQSECWISEDTLKYAPQTVVPVYAACVIFFLLCNTKIYKCAQLSILIVPNIALLKCFIVIMKNDDIKKWMVLGVGLNTNRSYWRNVSLLIKQLGGKMLLLIILYHFFFFPCWRE